MSQIVRETGDDEAKADPGKQGTDQIEVLRKSAAISLLGSESKLREEDLKRVRASLGRGLQEADREDLLQEALFRGLKNGICSEDGRLTAYACVAARTQLVDHLRRITLVSWVALEDEDLLDQAPSPAASLEADEERSHLRWVLNLLPQQDRQVLAWQLEGLSIEKMAAAAGATPVAIEQRIRRACRKARRYYAQQERTDCVKSRNSGRKKLNRS